MTLHFVATLDQLDEAKPKLVMLAGRSIGVIRSNGNIYAVRNLCPHKRAPVCQGTVKGTMLPSDPNTFMFGLEDQVLQCPWHGWEFDLNTGRTLCGHANKKLTFYPVTVKDDAVYLDL